MMTTTGTGIDAAALEAKVKDMYTAVAEAPHGSYHFEMGRGLAERLGYPANLLDRIPARAVESFAGVGWFFDLAGLGDGEAVLDLGSGSGMDAFLAALHVGDRGRVIGIDMTPAQLAKAERLATESSFDTLTFVEGRIEDLPFDDEQFDCVISNGVINLSAAKDQVFAEARRVLRPGGRLALADIVTETQLPESIVANPDLWAACIGGATHQDRYRQTIEAAGFEIHTIRPNDYQFLSDGARGATTDYGVKSLTILARRKR
jgi:SAM-dependent methyltransferase